MEASIITPQFEQNLLQNEVAGNYRQMVKARAAGELVLEKTFEQRMNNGLQSYYDLMVYRGRVGEVDYDQA